MLAGSCYSKGERIHELPTECSAVLTTIESKEHCHTCHLFLPPHTELTRCSTCSSLWCSKTCRESCLEHEYLCKSRLYSDFLRYVNKSGTIKHVASLILRAIFASLSESTCSNDKTLLKCLSDRVNEFLLPYTKSVYFSEYASSTTNNSDESAESEEIYYLFKSALLFDSVVPSVVFEEVITFNTWVTFHSVLRTFSVPLFTPHPMTVSLQALARIPNTAQRHALFAPFRTYCSPESNQAADSVLATERELLRLVQSINTDDDPFNSLGFHGLVLSSFLPLMRHSCAPNTMYESCVQDEQVYVFNTAMHDVAKDEELTTSYISLTEQSIRQRSIELQRLFGDGFTCECVKCCFERRVGRRSFSSLDTSSDFINACSLLKRPSLLMLMRVYMQQQHFFVALSIGRTLVTADEEGDVFHMMGAALLSLGQCGDAQKVWFSGANKCTTHLRLLADDSKCRAYFRGNVLASTHNQLLCESITVKQGLVAHLSLEPLLSGEECNRIVRIAEELAVSRGGWTTSRHYAVPTTDIAIHTSTLLLQWFNDLMCMTIYPALHRQFGGDDEKATEIFVHDAFVVKYQADEDGGSQRHLPLHTDESTHSFVLSLSPCAEYEGGGTFFVDLGRAIKPERGHLLTFPGGSLQHGGDPIFSGTRYIVAAFIYIEDSRKSLSLYQDLLSCEAHVGASAVTLASKAKRKAECFVSEAVESSAGFEFNFGL